MLRVNAICARHSLQACSSCSLLANAAPHAFIFMTHASPFVSLNTCAIAIAVAVAVAQAPSSKPEILREAWLGVHCFQSPRFASRRWLKSRTWIGARCILIHGSVTRHGPVCLSVGLGRVDRLGLRCAASGNSLVQQALSLDQVGAHPGGEIVNAESSPES